MIKYRLEKNWHLVLAMLDATSYGQQSVHVGLPIIGLLLSLIFLGASNIDKIYPQIQKDLKNRKGE